MNGVECGSLSCMLLLLVLVFYTLKETEKYFIVKWIIQSIT